jgi:hypothetical protein
MIFDLVTIASFCVVIPFLVGVISYKKMPGAGRCATWLMGAWLVAECSAYYLRIQGYTNWIVYVLLSYAEISIVTILFLNIFVSNFAKKITLWLACLGLLIVSLELLIGKGASSSVTIMYESFFFFGMGLYAFYETIVLNAFSKFNLLNIGIMLMFLGSAVYFASWQFMKVDIALFKLFGNAHAVLLIICYSIFTVGLWRLR